MLEFIAKSPDIFQQSNFNQPLQMDQLINCTPKSTHY
jgi:hypothetical protein